MGLDVNEGFKELSELLKAEKLVIFAGSGISVDSGLPNWDGLLDKFIDICHEYMDILKDDIKDELNFESVLTDAKSHKNKSPLRTVSVLKNQIEEIDKVGYSFGDFVKQELQRLFLNAKPNINHELIVDTSYQYILTSNYDMLLEEAARAYKHKDLICRSFSYKKACDFAQALYEEKPGIMHIHGKASNISIDEFVLTSKDYLKIKKNYPGFRLGIQNIFLRYSVLLFGYGGNDPHLEEIIEEINFLFKDKVEFLPKYYLVLKEHRVDEILRKYKEDLNRTKIITIKDSDEGTELLRKLRDFAPRKK